ncbi:uncharacterized protein LOC111068640 isoform X2 [Drosophila obscura]|uniref:uncharacterized protein LOC111068640 isoform X2 n=1 Tax=Drosophila obscura TaxID=7282 RepID=UPI001BB1EF21|nr:uncharacterized protein LOC111068640 isoform X2 [Drosophila obscura]
MENQDNKNGDLTAKEMAKFLYCMDKFLPPLDLKNDIVYCQRALRDFIKVHSLVSEVFSQQEDADPVAMRRILDELEEEMYEINAECQYLMLRLDEDVLSFLKKLEAIDIKTDLKEANAHVSTLLVPLIADEDYMIIPKNVGTRDTEETLIRKHFLLSQEGEDPPMNLSDLDDNIALMLGPTDTTIQIELENGDAEQAATLESSQETPTQSQLAVPASLLRSLPDTVIRTVEQGESQPPPLLIATTTQKSQQRSLLIPRKQPETFGMHQQKRISSTSPPPLAPITIEFPQAQVQHQAVVQDPAKAELDFEQVEASRGNLRQVLKRSRKTKQMPRLCYEDHVELTTLETDTKRRAGKVTQITNVAKAVQNNASSLSIAEKPDKTPTPPTPPPLPSPPLPKRQGPGVGAGANKTSKIRKTLRKSSPEAQPEGPGAGAGGSPSASSDDSTTQELQQEQQRLSASAAQWRDEPRETRVMAAEYGQETFLRIFGLYTPEVITKLSQRHSKRKRRNVQNASGVDFHYGQQMNATLDTPMGRQKKVKNKPEFLLSPKEKRLQAKKADVRKSKTPDKAAAEASQTVVIEGEDAAAAAAVAAAKCRKCRGECQHCRQCKRLVGKDDGVCEQCDGVYHKDCHQPTKSRLLAQSQRKRCPPCCREMRETMLSVSSSGSSTAASSSSSSTTKKAGGAQTV